MVFDDAKKAAYFIWEYTKCENAISLWHCAEDIADFFASCGMISTEDILNFARKEKYSLEYISFVRHIAYRLYAYTGRDDETANWFDAEKLINNAEWVCAIVGAVNKKSDISL